MGIAVILPTSSALSASWNQIYKLLMPNLAHTHAQKHIHRETFIYTTEKKREREQKQQTICDCMQLQSIIHMTETEFDFSVQFLLLYLSDCGQNIARDFTLQFQFENRKCQKRFYESKSKSKIEIRTSINVCLVKQPYFLYHLIDSSTHWIFVEASL